MKHQKKKNHQLSKKIKLLENCSICCQQKERWIDQQQFDKFRLPDICYDCWFAHVKNYIMRISYRAGDDVISPFSQGPSIDIIKCINSFNNQHSKEIQEALFKKYSSFTQEIQKCPSQTCDFVYIGIKCKWGSNENIYNCPKCDIPLSPNKSTSFKSLMASFYLIMANKCPKCDIPIEKISGCPHMTCPCGHHFCWYCYKDHPSGTGKRVYPFHSIPQCAFIFISKIILFMMCFLSLLIIFNGNSIIKDIFRIIASIFSVLFRAAIIDGFSLAQIMYFMMRKRRRFPNSYSKKDTKRYIAITVLLNLVFFGILYFMQELIYFLMILLGEATLGVVCYGIGYGIIYSIETWFEFIA